MEIIPLPADRWAGSPVRYPDPAVRVLDPRFERYRIDSAAVERIATGYRWAEGPVWFGDHRCLLWSDIPNNRMMRWDEQTGAVSVFRSPSNFANGNIRDGSGRLVSCEHLTRRVTRTEHDGRITVLADSFDGAPAQRAQRRRGQRRRRGVVHRPRLRDHVRLRGRQGRVRAADPGLSASTRTAVRSSPSSSRWSGPTACASPRRSPCSMSSTPAPTRDHPRVRHVRRGGRPTAGCSSTCARARRTASDATSTATCGPRRPAAVTATTASTSSRPTGPASGPIVLPEQCANLCFGGRRNNRLFMAAGQSVYSLYTYATGL